ncbi:hypothetical protein D3C76_1847280 [compost metagenome]
MPSHREVADPRQRDQHQISRIRRDAGQYADECKDIGERPMRGYHDKLVDQRGDKP